MALVTPRTAPRAPRPHRSRAGPTCSFVTATGQHCTATRESPGVATPVAATSLPGGYVSGIDELTRGVRSCQRHEAVFTCSTGRDHSLVSFPGTVSVTHSAIRSAMFIRQRACEPPLDGAECRNFRPMEGDGSDTRQTQEISGAERNPLHQTTERSNRNRIPGNQVWTEPRDVADWRRARRRTRWSAHVRRYSLCPLAASLRDSLRGRGSRRAPGKGRVVALPPRPALWM
jgi:hypothetical protein